MSDYQPSLYEAGVSHYYGNQVRQLLIVAATLILIGAPFYADSLRSELPFEIIGALVLVAIAALVNPHSKLIFAASAIASGIGLVIYESWALYMYFDSSWAQFVLREAIAVILLIAFYFSMKTIRAFVLRQVGKHEEAGEFDEPVSTKTRQHEKTVLDDFLPWTNRKGNNNTKKMSEDIGPRMSPGRSPEEIKPKYHPFEEQL
ncbi:hypothetical protein A2853_02240 [Candidatus Kaiserbacteria bacterium RIFCSPHIGHO2_01_FULL_55_17]|uniref:Uncharacterized protein n=1 Tax=Candidatus Kaiserbacteria bacterium RIFCSPHIGHO2_01_FULL_55_17 TaxID=1798484 RepID=A0A1F6D7L5_9BACT|nr:MAG: hypothetical protein A2853_02240 [Candidatus Kaiserbacteria bacterium RIFCSPHIGHO2_01_FULL_55_17]